MKPTSVHDIFIISLFLFSHFVRGARINALEDCRSGMYPPKGPTVKGNVTWYTVNLDLAPSERWMQVIKDKNTELITMVRTIKDLATGFFHGKLVDLVGEELPLMVGTLPQPFNEEIKGIAAVSGIPLGEITLFNIFYEVFTVCTSVVAEDFNGNIYHARNLDFGLFMGTTDWVGPWSAAFKACKDSRLSRWACSEILGHFYGPLFESMNHYQLQFGVYTGSAGDALSGSYHPEVQWWASHQGMTFSTRDRDNDRYDRSCDQEDKSGWWFNRCHSDNLNGFYHRGPYSAVTDDGIVWYPWHGWWYSLKSVQTKIRPASFEPNDV